MKHANLPAPLQTFWRTRRWHRRAIALAHRPWLVAAHSLAHHRGTAAHPALHVAPSPHSSATASTHVASTHVASTIGDTLPRLGLLIGGEYRNGVTLIDLHLLARALRVGAHPLGELPPCNGITGLSKPTTGGIETGPERLPARFGAAGDRRESNHLGIGELKLAGVGEEQLNRRVARRATLGTRRAGARTLRRRAGRHCDRQDGDNANT